MLGERSTSSNRLHVAGSTAIAALSEPTSVLESSLSMQVGWPLITAVTDLSSTDVMVGWFTAAGAVWWLCT